VNNHLYRITSFDRAVEIIQQKKLYFAHPSSWEDPYESVLRHERSAAIFAQCWCRKSLSDAMWRIYSPNGLGVRIGTTRQRLQEALTEAKSRQPDLRFKIKNVEYLYQEELDFKLDDVRKSLLDNYTFSNAIEPLLLKRKAFDHERETRAVLYNQEYIDKPGTKGISIQIEPFEFVTSIWVDPRAPTPFVEAYRHYLKNVLGFPGTVKKSTLYAIPNQLSVEHDES
jgi:hypothetical protein